MLNFLTSLFKPNKSREAARELYAEVIIAARQVPFYTDMQVPDTVEGRFDMLTMHMYLILNRLKSEDPKVKAFAQELFDLMFRDMDNNLREMGVGDMSIGKKVRGLAESFYGRIGAYDAAFQLSGTVSHVDTSKYEHENEDGEKVTIPTNLANLEDAIARNIFSVEADTIPVQKAIRQLSEYFRANMAHMQEQSVERILLGVVSFKDITEFSDD